MALAATRAISVCRPVVRIAPSLGPSLNRRSQTTPVCMAAKEVFEAQEAANLLSQGYQYVDVRGPDEFSAGHAPGAVNIPLGPTLVSGFKEKFPLGTEKLLVACQGGKRSTMALDMLGGAYPEAINFKGSFGAWAAAGMPVEK